MSQRRIDRHILAGGDTIRYHRLVVPIIPKRPRTNTRKDTINSRSALNQTRRNKQRATEQELAIRSRKPGFVGEVPGEGAHGRGARSVAQVEGRVQVGQQGVADAHGGLRGVGDGGPDVRLLERALEHVVVAVEGEEGRQLHPARAELQVGVAREPARVDAEHGDAEERERERLRDREVHVGPERVVVSPIVGQKKKKAWLVSCTVRVWVVLDGERGGLLAPNGRPICRNLQTEIAL